MKEIYKCVYLTILSFSCGYHVFGQQIYEGERGVTIRNDSGQPATIHIEVTKELKESKKVSSPTEKYHVTINSGEKVELIWPLTVVLPPGPRFIPEIKKEHELFYLTTVKRVKSGQKPRKAAKFDVSVQKNDSGGLSLSYSFTDHLSPAWDESVADGPREGVIYLFENLENVILDVSKPTSNERP